MDANKMLIISDVMDIAFWGVIFMWANVVTIATFLVIPTDTLVPVFPYSVYLLFVGFGLKFVSRIVRDRAKQNVKGIEV